MPSLRTQQLLDRIPSGHRQSDAMRRVVETTLTLGERFQARRRELHADPKLTGIGRSETLKAELLKTYARDLRDAKEPIRKARAELDALRSAVKVRPGNPADVSEALLRTEIRSTLFAMNPSDRAAVLVNPATDVRIVEAVLSAPALLSGVDPNVMGHVEEAYQAAKFGPQMEEITELEEIVASAEAAAQIARDDIRATLEMDERAFDQLVKPIETKEAGPLLVSHGDRTQAMTIEPDGRASYRPATTDDLRDGIHKGTPEYDAELARRLQAAGVSPARAA